MNDCGGLTDWLVCLRCEHICTRRCPLEGDNAAEKLARQLKMADEAKNSKQHNKQ